MHYLLSLILLCNLLCVSCFSLLGAQESKVLIPKGYEGPVFIIFDQENGVQPGLEDNVHVYKILPDGILKTTVKVNYQFEKHEFFYVDDNGNRTEIPYLYPSGWGEGEKTFENIDYSKEEIYVFSDEMGATEKNGKTIRFRQFLIGKAKNANKLAMEAIKKTAQATDQPNIFNKE